jgi:hypothetical protein
MINKFKNIIMAGLAAVMTVSCAGFLDVVPDNIATIDNAFQNRGESEKYLVGLYSYLPGHGSTGSNPALMGAGEVYYDWSGGFGGTAGWLLGSGNLGPTSMYFDDFRSMMRGLRDINIFFENIHRPYDLPEWEREQWTGEVLFLKAYYHFWLFRKWGPIPLIKENIPIGESTVNVQRYRDPVDSCIAYICELLDLSMKTLPSRVSNEQRDLGKPDRMIALALKAQVLTYAASPLFNGNTDYADFMDERKIPLFSQTYDPKKWELAAEALKAAIDAAHDARKELYDFRRAATSILQATYLSETTINNMQVRGAVTEKWNSEIIWGDPRGTDLQGGCFPAFNRLQWNNFSASYSSSVDIARKFYTKNGLPIREDQSWYGADLTGWKIATWEDRQYVHVGDTTLVINFNREPRFYSSLTFDHATFYGNGREYEDNEEDEGAMWTTDYVKLDPTNHGSRTGYLCKKFVHFKSTVADNSVSPIYTTYPFPIIRLADLYLMYAEVLNEIKSAPDAEVYEYIDRVRRRIGLEGVVDTWRKYGTNEARERPSKKDEMRKIIHLERQLELMYEGVFFWDVRRWKEADDYYTNLMNEKIWLYMPHFGGYDPINLVPTPYSFRWQLKQYFWPIALGSVLIDDKLIQAPGY